MSVPSPLRKTVLFSVIGHIAVFGIFSFSFGEKIPKIGYTSVAFWGEFLTNAQVSTPLPVEDVSLRVRKTSAVLPLKDYDATSLFSKQKTDWQEKPALNLAFSTVKEVFTDKPISSPFSLRRKKEPAIIFHPLLPYSFNLYFKDRQVAHVEVDFNIVSRGRRNSVIVKRKISSGNLEVDLLSMRYIGHYLFIQQARFTPDKWRTVKIDLSAPSPF